MPNRTRARIERENLKLAVGYFSRKLLTFESFEPIMYVGNHNPTERYIEAKAAFETAKVGNARLTGWADLYVNSEGWKMFRSRIRTQKRKDSRSGGQVLRVREFTDATIKELHEVRINISEKKTFNLDETLKYLIDFWKNN